MKAAGHMICGILTAMCAFFVASVGEGRTPLIKQGMLQVQSLVADTESSVSNTLATNRPALDASIRSCAWQLWGACEMMRERPRGPGSVLHAHIRSTPITDFALWGPMNRQLDML